MKRSPLKRGSPLTRSTRVRASNPARRAKTFARNFGERGEAVRAMSCLVHWRRCQLEADGSPRLTSNDAIRFMQSSSMCPASETRQAAHVRARGMGGAKGDRRDLVPLCAKHHAEAGEHRTSARAAFEARYRLDLIAEAERIAVELDERGLA